MSLLEEILEKGQKLPLYGCRGEGVVVNRIRAIKDMTDRGLSAFSSVINESKIYLPVNYFKHVTTGSFCDKVEITFANIPLDVYAQAVYRAINSMHSVWVAEYAKAGLFPDRVMEQRCFLPLPLVSREAVDIYLDVWRVILDDLQQNQGDSPVIEAWNEARRQFILENGIESASAEDLGGKIASGSMEFLHSGEFTWASWLQDSAVAKNLAMEVVLGLVELIREVNR